MNTQDFYVTLVSETTENNTPLFVALRTLTQMDDPRNVFAGDAAAVPWTAWYAATTDQA
jgi:hypothetical protein